MRWIIGDIHGMLRPLEALLSEIDRIDSQRQLFFAGDYVNRGPQSKGVVDCLLALSGATFIRGNHDDVMDQVVNEHSFLAPEWPVNRPQVFAAFCRQGLVQTMYSYDVTDREIRAAMETADDDAFAAIVEKVPPAHRQFFQSLRGFVEEPEFFVTHGHWSEFRLNSPADVEDMPLTVRRDMLWGRFAESELISEPRWAKRGFFGHTPVQSYAGHDSNSTPIRFGQATLIDTAVALLPHGRLTAWCFEEDRAVQVDRDGGVIR